MLVHTVNVTECAGTARQKTAFTVAR